MRRWTAWGIKHVALAGAYALGYLLFREVSFPHWLPLSGLRLLCLFLVPRPYWVTLALAEMLPLSMDSLSEMDRWGQGWAIFNAIPPVVMAMPVAYYLRKRRALNVNGLFPINSFIAGALTVSTVWTLCFVTTFHLMKPMPGESPIDLTGVVTRLFLGNYLGVLTVVPVGLWMAKDAWPAIKCGALWKMWGKLLVDTAVTVLPLLTVLGWIAESGPDELRGIARMGMFVPAIWLAKRYGWQGTAISGCLSSICAIVTMPVMFDLVTMQAQALMAFAVSTMLLFGTYISKLNHKNVMERVGRYRTLKLVQQSLFIGDISLLDTACNAVAESGSLDYIHAPPRDASPPIRAAISALVSNKEKQIGILDNAFDLLSEHVKTEKVERYTLSLDDDELATALRSLGVDYLFEEQGIGQAELNPRTQLALRRLVREATAYLFQQGTFDFTRVKLRTMRLAGDKQLAVIRITVKSIKPARTNDQSIVKHLAETLRVRVLPLWTIRRHAHLYEGDLHLRPIDGGGWRVTMMVHDQT